MIILYSYLIENDSVFRYLPSFQLFDFVIILAVILVTVDRNMLSPWSASCFIFIQIQSTYQYEHFHGHILPVAFTHISHFRPYVWLSSVWSCPFDLKFAASKLSAPKQFVQKKKKKRLDSRTWNSTTVACDSTIRHSAPHLKEKYRMKALSSLSINEEIPNNDLGKISAVVRAVKMKYRDVI